jgi:hypothetical protein
MRYAAIIEKHSSSAYCRTSAESSIIGGRKVASSKPIQPGAGPKMRLNQAKSTQQNTLPAITDGRRRTNADVPRLRQRCKIRNNSGG